MGGSVVEQGGRLLTVLLVAAMCIVEAQQQGIQAWKTRNAPAPTGLIVKYRNDVVSTQSVEMSINKIQSHSSFKSQRKMLVNNAYAIEAKDAAGARQLRRYLKQQDQGLIEYIDYDLRLSAFSMPSECSTSTTDCTDSNGKYWGQKNMKVDHVWYKMAFGGTGILAGVIDTGIEWDHPELAGVVDISSSTSCMGGGNPCSTTSPTMNGKDDDSHGTHCTGIMAAMQNSGAGTPIGVAQSAKIISCKFMDSTGSGLTSGAVDCIQYLINKGVKVLSNSWGGDGTISSLGDVIQAACNANVLFFVAAGNDNVNVNAGTDGTGSYPANYAGQTGYDCVIGVAAITASNKLASFSDFGSNVMIAAPGLSIYSTVRVADGSYAYYSGTSMATPFVAGAALALWNTFPTLTMKQVKDSIINSATVTATPYYFNGGIGGKVLNVEAAVAAAQLLVASPVNCVGGYTAWSPCNATCGPGTQTRTYVITTPASGGGTSCTIANGTIDTQPCNLGSCNSNCTGNFTDWSTCDKACGGGNQSRTYIITAPASGTGVACPHPIGYTEVQACHTDACTGNCTGDFGNWTACSLPCGGGSQSRTYIVTSPGAEGGTPCPHNNSYTETQTCNTDPCPAPVDCVGGYTAWGPCSRTCGSGTQNRMFLVTIPAANSGKDCTPTNGTVETQVCNTQACPPPPPACRRDNQCGSYLRNMQLPANTSMDCYSSSCSSGFCKLNPKYAGARCRGGYCDGAGFCKACLPQSPATCPISSPLCLVSMEGTNQCGCLGDASCPANAPFCKDSKLCVQCLDDTGCATQSVKKMCNSQYGACVQCLNNTDCSSTLSTPFCAASSCVQCLSSSDCTGNARGSVCNPLSKTCGCARNSDCTSLPSNLPSGFDVQCLTPACTSFISGQCSVAAVSNKACIVPGSSSTTSNGYCLVTMSRGKATGATCVACKSSGTNCGGNGECCSSTCRSSRFGRRQCV